MIHVKSEGYNLTWVNCEMASFIHMKESRNFFVNPHAHGIIVQVPTPLSQGFGSWSLSLVCPYLPHTFTADAHATT